MPERIEESNPPGRCSGGARSHAQWGASRARSSAVGCTVDQRGPCVCWFGVAGAHGTLRVARTSGALWLSSLDGAGSSSRIEHRIEIAHGEAAFKEVKLNRGSPTASATQNDRIARAPPPIFEE
jgi:hypothetical protein